MYAHNVWSRYFLITPHRDPTYLERGLPALGALIILLRSSIYWWTMKSICRWFSWFYNSLGQWFSIAICSVLSSSVFSGCSLSILMALAVLKLWLKLPRWRISHRWRQWRCSKVIFLLPFSFGRASFYSCCLLPLEALLFFFFFFFPRASMLEIVLSHFFSWGPWVRYFSSS